MKNIKKVLVSLLGAICLLYILNPTAGVFELVPDNIPFVGNLDEGLAAYFFFSCIQYLRGKYIGVFDKEKNIISKIQSLNVDKNKMKL